MSDPTFVSAFVYSIEKAMRSMLGASCWLLSGPPSADPERQLSGVIYLSGRANGRISLTFPWSTARRVVAGMLGIDPAELNDTLLRDGVAEMTNIVAGNAKALLADTPHAFQISLPRVTWGDNEDLGAPSGRRAVRKHFQSALGPLAVAVSLDEVRSAPSKKRSN